MTFDEYREKARTTARYPHVGSNLIYPTLGLVGEAGEIANKVKKIDRDHGGTLTDEMRKELLSELGDVLWYISCVADELGSNVNDVAEANIQKLASRNERGTLHGSGDER